MFTPLMCSVYSGSLKCMKHLIEVIRNYFLVQYSASFRYHCPQSNGVIYIIVPYQAGADLNLKCPLAISICRESIEILKCLLKAGAAPNVRTEVRAKTKQAK